MKEGGAEVVKIEGGEKRTDLIRRIIDAEIPVAGHIGLTPQSLNVMGGYKVQGKDLSGIEHLMRDAVALNRAGVACLFLEGIPREVGAMITAEVETPTIGIKRSGVRRAGFGISRHCESDVRSTGKICAPVWRRCRTDHPCGAGFSRGRAVAAVSVRCRVSSEQGNQSRLGYGAGAKARHAALASYAWICAGRANRLTLASDVGK